MKRILILTILLMSSLAWAGSTTVVVGQGGGGACSSSLASAQGSASTTNGVGSSQTEMYYTKVTAGATGYANTMIMRTQYGGDGENIWMAVYDSDGDLMAEISPIASSAAAADVSSTLDTQICIESGEVYYLAFQIEAEGLIWIFRESVAGNNIWKVKNTYGNGPPATINPTTDGIDYAGYQMNIRVDYE